MSRIGLENLYPSGELPNQRLRYQGLAGRHAEVFPASSASRGGRFFSAPGRTEICGNHTDHNGGSVICSAVDLDIAAYAVPRTDRRVRIDSMGFPFLDIDLGDLAPRPDESGTSAAIVRGMAMALQTHGLAEPRGFDAVVDSRVPPGSGLSSSAAFEVLAGMIMSTFSGKEIPPYDLAKAGKYAENVYFGKPSGLMDQMACAIGSAILIDFEDPKDARFEILDFDPQRHGYSLVVLGTGGSHEDLTPDYAAIPREMGEVAALFGKTVLAGISKADLAAKAGAIRDALGDRAFLRAWHFAGETARSREAASFLKRGDFRSFLGLVAESGYSSLAYLQNLYSPHNLREQGLVVGLAMAKEFLAGQGAARVHGGGFAGTIQSYVPTPRLEEYLSYLGSAFGATNVFPLHTRRHGVVCIDSIRS